MVGERATQGVGQGATVCIIEIAIRWTHSRLRINIVESRERAADGGGPAGSLLIKVDQITLQLSRRQRAAAHRRPIESAPPDWEPDVLREKRRLIGRV